MMGTNRKLKPKAGLGSEPTHFSVRCGHSKWDRNKYVKCSLQHGIYYHRTGCSPWQLHLYLKMIITCIINGISRKLWVFCVYLLIKICLKIRNGEHRNTWLECSYRWCCDSVASHPTCSSGVRWRGFLEIILLATFIPKAFHCLGKTRILPTSG